MNGHAPHFHPAFWIETLQRCYEPIRPLANLLPKRRNAEGAKCAIRTNPSMTFSDFHDFL